MNNIIKRKWNQNSMVIIEDLQGMAFQAESGGHTFQISGIDGEGNAVALSGTPAGVMLRADGQDVALTCSVSGGVVSATLPANAYSVPGRFGLTIFLTSDGQKTAIYAAVGTVGKTSSGTVAPPAGSDVVDLVNAIAAAVATIPASYTDLMASVAPTYSSSGLYAVGSYAWYNGKLYRCTTPITTAETWTAAHWTLANLGSDLVDLKSALNTKRIRTISDFSLIADKRLNDAGVVFNQEGSSVSDLIPVSKYATIKYSLSGSSGWGLLALYDASKSFVSNVAMGAGWTTFQTGTYNVTDGVAYVRFAIITGQLSNSEFTLQDDYYTKINEINTSLIEDEEDIDNIKKDLYKKVIKSLSDVSVTVNKRISPLDGAENSADGFSASGFIPVEQGDVIDYKLSASSNCSLIALYNSAKVFTGNVAVGEGWDAYKSGTYTVASGVEYIRICFASDATHRANYIFSIAYTSPDLFRYMDDIVAEQDELKYDIYKKIINSISDVNMTAGKYIAYSDGTIGYNASVSVSEWIPVREGDVISYTLSGSDPFALLAGYDASKSNYVCIVQGAGWTTYKTGTYTVPSTVKYVRFCYITDYIANYSFSIQYAKPESFKYIASLNGKIKTINGDLGTVQALNFDSYWETELDTKIPIVRTKEGNGQIGKFLSFVFVTDMHYPYNYKKSTKLIKSVTDNLNIRYILNGGDNIHNGSTEVYTQENAVKTIIDMRKDFKKYDLDRFLLNTVGNHDFNDFGTGTALASIQLYDTMYLMQWNYTGQNLEDYSFYVDDEFNKIRFISDSVYFQNQTNIEWLGNVALNLPGEDWCAVIFSHALPFAIPSIGNTENRNNAHMVEVMEAFQNRGSVNIADPSTAWPIYYQKDFSNFKGHIALFVAGHVHTDYCMTQNGILYVTTVNDSKDSDGYIRTVGTIKEQNFNVFTICKNQKKIYATRIGYGSNREFDYDPDSETFGEIT